VTVPRIVEIEREARIEEMQRRVKDGCDVFTGRKVPGLDSHHLPLAEPTHKTCTLCGETKPIAEFYRQSSMRDGHRNECKTCQGKAWKRRYYERKEKP